tara:strand:+ start:3390 stop:4634 length:1245 start_codon:yes stop_codon:yes gene_type:complete
MMIIIYRIIINLILLFSPLIIIARLIKEKEDKKRFIEKFCFFSKKRGNGKLIWFHGASVGELQSIIPLLEKFEKNNKIKKILVTSNTLSSSRVLQKVKFKKIIHQFFPIDTNFHTKKFLDYWNPSSAFFIDSEIWPNMYLNLNDRHIPITLLNGRITKKSFSRWKIFPNFAFRLFNSFNQCFSASKESKILLEKLGANNVKFIGNLKFAQSENSEINLSNNIKKFLLSKRIWCASSTHNTEEKLCGLAHKELKRKYKNLLTIIIPRHIDRVYKIEKELQQLNLRIHNYQSNKKIDKNTDIFIVDVYGKTKSFYNLCKNVFLGGSIIDHGGQNPLEATRFGCNILHGPNISNFKEIYQLLNRYKVSQKVINQKQMTSSLNKLFQKKLNSKRMQKKLNLIGRKILDSTYNEIKLKL